MKLLALMLVRNEEWVLPASLPAALSWCDGAAVLVDRSTDNTARIVMHELTMSGKEAAMRERGGAPHWDEMDLRRELLDMGRELGGTHFAMIDADEILTANYASNIRVRVEVIQPAQVLEVPMIAMRSLEEYQNDGSVWSSAWLSLAFRDDPSLSWKPAADGYQHHSRCPDGIRGTARYGHHGEGGGMHLQFANPRRLLAKHVLYRMMDHLRWPARESVEELNWKYDQALEKPARLSLAPPTWWEGVARDRIDTAGVPWQEEEIRRLLAEHGRARFAGLDLKGF